MLAYKAFDKSWDKAKNGRNDKPFSLGAEFVIPESANGNTRLGYEIYRNPIRLLIDRSSGVRYTVVDAEDVTENNGLFAKKIKILRLLTPRQLIRFGVRYGVTRRGDTAEKRDMATAITNRSKEQVALNEEKYGLASNVVPFGSALNAGVHGSAYNTIPHSGSVNMADNGVSWNEGFAGYALNNGHRGVCMNSASYACAVNSGVSGYAYNCEEGSLAANSAYFGSALSSGSKGLAASSGNESYAENYGYAGLAVNSGDGGESKNCGIMGVSIHTGFHGRAVNTKDGGVSVALGVNGQAKGALGSWIILGEWSEKTTIGDRPKRIGVVAKLVDGVEIKPDTFYRLIGGKFVEQSS